MDMLKRRCKGFRTCLPNANVFLKSMFSGSSTTFDFPVHQTPLSPEPLSIRSSSAQTAPMCQPWLRADDRFCSSGRALTTPKAGGISLAPPSLALSGTSPRERYPSIWSSLSNSESYPPVQGFDLPHPSKSWGTPARGGCLVILLHASAGHAGPKSKLDHRCQISLAPKLAAITSGRYEHLGRSDNDRDGCSLMLHLPGDDLVKPARFRPRSPSVLARGEALGPVSLRDQRRRGRDVSGKQTRGQRSQLPCWKSRPTPMFPAATLLVLDVRGHCRSRARGWLSAGARGRPALNRVIRSLFRGPKMVVTREQGPVAGVSDVDIRRLISCIIYSRTHRSDHRLLEHHQRKLHCI